MYTSCDAAIKVQPSGNLSKITTLFVRSLKASSGLYMYKLTKFIEFIKPDHFVQGKHNHWCTNDQPSGSCFRTVVTKSHVCHANRRYRPIPQPMAQLYTKLTLVRIREFLQGPMQAAAGQLACETGGSVHRPFHCGGYLLEYIACRSFSR